MEVTLVATVGISLHALAHPGLHGEACVDNQIATRLDKFGEMGKTLKIILGRTIDVEVVGVGGGHHSHIGVQVMERTVKLVGLNHRIRAGG